MGLIDAYTHEEMLAAYEPLVFIPTILDRRPASDVIEFPMMPIAKEQRNTTMNAQEVNQKIRELLAEFMSMQRSGKRTDRQFRAKLHPGRGSSLKKLNRIIRTQIGLRPEKIFSAAEERRAIEIFGRIDMLRKGQLA